MSEQEGQEKLEELSLLRRLKSADSPSKNKMCIKCGTVTVKNPNKDWHKGPKCRPCYRKEIYALNPQKDIDRRRNNYNKNIERDRDRKRNSYFKNKEKIKEQRKAYYEKNKERILAHNKQYRAQNRKIVNDYFNSRYKVDTNFKIASRLRNRLKKAIKDTWRVGSAIQDLGCSVEEFKFYIESLFEPGMTWENYGAYSDTVRTWNFDHVMPLSSFNLSDPEQVKKACHYLNIQPKWSIDNLKKGNNVPTK